MAYVKKLMLKGEKMMNMASDMRDARMKNSIRRSTMIHTTIQSPRNVDEGAIAIEQEEMNIDPSFEGGPSGFDQFPLSPRSLVKFAD